MRLIFTCLISILVLNLSAQLSIDGADLINQLSNKTDTVYNQNYNNRNTHFLNVSVGFFNPAKFTFSLANIERVNGNPSSSINIDYNYALSSTMSIGAFANYYRVNAQYTPSFAELETVLNQSFECVEDSTDFFGILTCVTNQFNNNTTINERINVFTVGGKLSYHKRVLPKLDTYASTYLGYSFNKRANFVEAALEEYTGELLGKSDVNIPTFVYYINAGARYYINAKIGIYGEFGYGNIHLGKLGATYRY